MKECLESWFCNGGGRLNPGIEIASDSTGSFLRTRNGHDLSPGSCVVSCPHTLTLSWLNVTHGSESFVNDFDMQSASDMIDETVLTRFFLMKQYHLKEKSFWWPYIHSLPQPIFGNHPNTPLWYDAEDLVWLRGTNLEYAAREKEQLWRQEFDEGVRLLASGESEGEKGWSWQNYKWAATMLSSRGFPSSALRNATLAYEDKMTNTTNGLSSQTLQDDKIASAWPVLIPGLDLLNHLPSAKVTWDWGQTTSSIINNEPIGGGSQVWNNYGPKSNEELILGYGFTLFHNAADVCNLAVSPKVVQRVRAIQALWSKSNQVFEQEALYKKKIEETEFCVKTNSNTVILPTEEGLNYAVNQNIDNNKGSVSSNRPADPISQEIFWVSIKDDIPNLGQDNNYLLYEFSPCLLEICSKAFANNREITMSDACLSNCVNFAQTRLSRNKLHVMCAMTMMLQKQYFAIIKHNGDLPAWPRNEKQFHAARYRRGQVRILRSVGESIIRELRGMVGLSSSKTRDARVVRLEHILMESPQGFSTDYRAALNAGFGTRNAAKIRKNGWAQCAFTIWLCGLWLWDAKNLQKTNESPNSDVSTKIAQWLQFLRRVYGSPAVLESDISQNSKFNHSDADAKFDSSSQTEPTTQDERFLLVQSYLAVIEATVHKYPSSIFASPDLSVTYLRWCLDIIEAESVMCPNLEGKIGEEDDEFILFLEDGG